MRNSATRLENCNNLHANCIWMFLQRKKRASQKSGWLMENQRRSGNLEPFIPASNWLHFSGGFKRRSIWLYQNGPSWQLHWALRKHRWVHLRHRTMYAVKYPLNVLYENKLKLSNGDWSRNILVNQFYAYICHSLRSKSGSKTAAPSSRSCGKVEKSPQINMLRPVNHPPARLHQLLPGTFHRLKEWTVSTPVYLRAAALPTRLRLHRFWQTTPGTQPRTLRRICRLLCSSTTTTTPP